jgi:hypothetical protein
VNHPVLCILSTQYTFACFLWPSEQTAIISLYRINWFVFITEMDRVYCAVRIDFCIIQLNCCGVLIRPEGYVPLLPFLFSKASPVRCRQTCWLALRLDEFHRPRRRPTVTAPTTTMVLSPLPVGLSTKLKFLAHYTLHWNSECILFLQSHKIPVTSFYVNSEFYNVTLCLRFASCNCG